jgi:DNA modification methylase
MTVHYTDDQVALHLGDALDVLPTLADNSIDAVVCDPPYALANLHPDVVIDALAHWLAGDRAYIPTGRAGFMGAAWDGFVPPPAAWDECLRVLKPGGHLLAFAAPRTADLMGLSIRLAGFEIRDGISWIYGQGFPKGVDIAKAIDKRRDDHADICRVTSWLADKAEARGISRQAIDAHMGTADMAGWWTSRIPRRCAMPTPNQWEALRGLIGFDDAMDAEAQRLNARKGEIGEAWKGAEVIGEHAGDTPGPAGGRFSARDRLIRAAGSTEAAAWQGWNTQLKPAHEPVIVARKSTGFNTTVANVLEHGTGALNIGACRTEVHDGAYARNASGDRGHADNRDRQIGFQQTAGHTSDLGRWPTNVVFSHGEQCAGSCVSGCPIMELDAQSGVLTSGANPARRGSAKFPNTYGEFEGDRECVPARGADSGSASRFFPTFRYQAKAPASERPMLADGTQHVTTKPLELMRFLVRLVTPPGGTVLDPFAGSGTTLEAAILEGFTAIGIEREPQYADLCVARLSKPLQPSLFGA